MAKIPLLLLVLFAMSGSAAEALTEGDLDLAVPTARVEVTRDATGSIASKLFGRAGPIEAIRAAARTGAVNGRLKLFCGSRGFALSREGSIFDLEGGAIVRLLDRLSVTGSYRLFGYDLHGSGGDQFGLQPGGPFLALRLRF